MFEARIARADLKKGDFGGLGGDGITASLRKRRFYVSRF